jgi:hypothetical protein
MGDVNNEEVTKLRFGFYQTLGTLAVAVGGGKVTLLHTVFSTARPKTLGYLAIACLALAAILAQGAQEALLNRLSPLPRFRSPAVSLILKPRWRSIEAQYGCEAACGLLFGLGLVLFVIFAAASEL